MSESTYEPTVMFFGLTNLLANFQTMINDLLRNLIEIRDMAAFVNNVMVKTETGGEHEMKIGKEKVQEVDWLVLRGVKDI